MMKSIFPIRLCGIVLGAILASSALGQTQPQPVPEGTIDIIEKLGDRVSIDLPFLDESGTTVTIRELAQGKPAIIAPVFYRCRGICPVTLMSMREVLDRVQKEPLEDFVAFAISFSPSESPELARDQKRNYLMALEREFPEDGWRFLADTAGSAKQICDEMGFYFQDLGSGMYDHKAALILVAADGKICRYIRGNMAYSPMDLAIAIDRTANGEIMESIWKSDRSLWEKCFGYDAKTGAGPVILKVAGFVMILSFIALVVLLLKMGKKDKNATTP